MSRRPGRSAILYGAAGVLATGASVATIAAGPGRGDPPRALTARVPVPAGTVLDAARLERDFAVLDLPRGTRLVGLVTPEGALGRRAVGPLLAGEPVTQAALGGIDVEGPAPLRTGERAVPVPLRAAGGAATTLVPGDLVDVVSATGEGLTGRAEVVVPAAEVLAVEAGDGAEGEVLLRTDARAALRVAGALNFSRDVRLLRRPRGVRP